MGEVVGLFILRRLLVVNELYDKIVERLTFLEIESTQRHDKVNV